MTYAWFRYNNGDMSNPLSYSFVNGEPSCPLDNTLCAVYAEVQYIDRIPRPRITAVLYEAIQIAISSKQESPEVKLRD